MICKFCGHVYIVPCHGKNTACGNYAWAEQVKKHKLEKPDENEVDVPLDVPERST